MNRQRKTRDSYLHESIAPAAPGRILVVDDTPANIQTLAAALKEKGCQISVATNGKQALDVLARVPPDLILLDVMLPEMDGFETCQRIKASEQWRHIPVNYLGMYPNCHRGATGL